MFQIDTEIMNFVATFRDAGITKIFIFFTYLGNWQIIIGLSIVAVVILGLLRKKREIIFLLAALISGEVIKELLKFLIHRPRPDISFSLISENGYAFPSGHAVMSVIFYGAIVYFIYKLCKKTRQKIILLTGLATLIILIGLSRIYLGVHWASDIVGGWLIGLSILAFFIAVFERLKRPTLPDLKDLK